MKLYFFKAAEGNVGDDLNPWLWPKVLPEILDDDPAHLLIGIGTLLNHRIPKAERYTVLSAGIGYGNKPPLQTGIWEFIALRGPRSQQAVGAKDVPCLLDGGYLMPEYFQPDASKRYSVAYIPHVDSILCGQWQRVCQLAGIKMLDPRWPVEKFITELCSCEQVLTEAMHGAILADAYDIPWHPVKAYDFINDFKWQDWAESVDMNISFSRISPTWKGDIGQSSKRKMIHGIKRTVKYFGFYPNSWTPVPPPASTEAVINKVAEQLKALAESAQFSLSDSKLRSDKVNELLVQIEKLKQAYTK